MSDTPPTKSEVRELFHLLRAGNEKIEDVSRDIASLSQDIKTLQRAINGSIDGSTKGLRESVRDNGFRIQELRARLDSVESLIAELRKERTDEKKDEKADRQWLWNLLLALASVTVGVMSALK